MNLDKYENIKKCQADSLEIDTRYFFLDRIPPEILISRSTFGEKIVHTALCQGEGMEGQYRICWQHIGICRGFKYS